MSDTPRTDAAFHNPMSIMYDPVCEMKVLERELNAATSEIERLRKANLQLREGAEEQKQRIKRLEEAGDAMINEGWNEPHLANAWRKAKEAKP